MAHLKEKYDVIVAGGGTAGVAAATAAARQGSRTLLIERNHCLGGAATMRGVSTWCGFHALDAERRQVVFGIVDEVLRAQDALGGLGPILAHRGVFRPFDSEVLKVVLDEVVTRAGVDVRFGAMVQSAERDGDNISSITVATHGGLETFIGCAFVDCSGEGDLAAFGGASTRYGNTDGVNLGSLACRFGGLPNGKLITVDDVTKAVTEQSFLQGAVTKDRCVTVRLPISGDLVLYLASHDYDPRDSQSLSNAEIDVRKQSWNYLKAIKSIDGCENAYLVSTGPEIGTRESRHLNCLHHFTWAEIEERTSQENSIALGAWGSEWHDRNSYASNFEYPPEKTPYEIPMGCLESIDTPNLFCAGRLADGDRKAGAAIRVMATSMATGQAAGTAAALLASARYSAAELQSVLRADGVITKATDL